MHATRILVPILLALALLGPAASAHQTRPSDDGQYCITVGNLNEPVTTYAKTGLDLIIRESLGGEGVCAGADRGDEVSGVHLTLTAVLIAPDGQEMADDLRVQFGQVGRYSFTGPYVLTQTGQYNLRLQGTIGDTMVDGTYPVSEPIPAWQDHLFPATVQNPEQLQGEVELLQARVAALEAQLAASNDSRGAPAAGPLAVLALLGVAALLVSRRS